MEESHFGALRSVSVMARFFSFLKFFLSLTFFDRSFPLSSTKSGVNENVAFTFHLNGMNE